MVDLFVVEGSSSDYVTQKTNAAGMDIPTPILEVSPDRGLFLRFLNNVPKGDNSGLPIYADLRDSNGDPLPSNTVLVLQATVAGSDDRFIISEKRGNISFYNSNDITTQQDVDNVDGSKIKLQAPDAASASGEVPKHDIRDIDSLYVSVISAAQIDWANSSLYFDSEAVVEGER